MNTHNKNQSVANQTSELFAGYRGGEDMPLGGYAVLLGIYNTALIALLGAAIARESAENETSEKMNFADILLVGVATHKLSRIVSRDRVTSPLRAPFTEYEKPAGENEVSEKSRGTGLQRAVGDLLTCPWCVTPWIAAGLTFGMIFKPRATRIITGLFTAATVSDALNHAVDAVKKSEK